MTEAADNPNFFDLVHNGDYDAIVNGISEDRHFNFAEVRNTNTGLILLCDKEKNDKIEALLDIFPLDECNVSHVNGYGNTALILACAAGYKHFVEKAITMMSDDDISLTNQHGNNALGLACEKGWGDIAMALLEAGCDPLATNIHKQTPLILAINEGLHDVSLAIAKRGTDFSQVTKRGNTALILACDQKHDEKWIDVIMALLAHECATEQINEYGNTAFILACETRRWDAAILMITTQFCSPGCVNKKGHSALFYMFKGEAPIELVILLLNCLINDTIMKLMMPVIESIADEEVTPDYHNLFVQLVNHHLKENEVIDYTKVTLEV